MITLVPKSISSSKALCNPHLWLCCTDLHVNTLRASAPKVTHIGRTVRCLDCVQSCRDKMLNIKTYKKICTKNNYKKKLYNKTLKKNYKKTLRKLQNN